MQLMDQCTHDRSTFFTLDNALDLSDSRHHNDTMSVDFDPSLPWYSDLGFTIQEPGYPKTAKIEHSSSYIGPQDLRWITDGTVDQFSCLGTVSPTTDLPPSMAHPDEPNLEKCVVTPVIKAEENGSPPIFSSPRPHSTPYEAHGQYDADVDTLMKAIQTKSRQQPQQLPSSPDTASCRRDSHSSIESSMLSTSDEVESSTNKKRYQCNILSCGKTFTQKARLNVHSRAHTGYKPYRCKAAGCGQAFSQMGNLKTHERRHTGERPFRCGLCNRSFAQSGNMRAHRIVHQRVKPYHCRLEECGKRFTQLGNLKSHQNKFHTTVLRDLTRRFASLRQGNIVSLEDKELWDYFSTLYRHSNKGIKGRGKDRRILLIEELEERVKIECDSKASQAG